MYVEPGRIIHTHKIVNRVADIDAGTRPRKHTSAMLAALAISALAYASSPLRARDPPVIRAARLVRSTPAASTSSRIWTPMAMPDEPPEIDPRRTDPDKPGPFRQPVQLPTVGFGDKQMDVVSRLLSDRILLLGTQVDDERANVLVAQLLYLAGEDSGKDCTLYINSPGGSVSAGMALFDTMQYVPCDVSTLCFGTAASMGAFLLGAGVQGKRRSLPNSRIMIHQPLGGAQGQAADIEIQAKEILYVRAVLNQYLADFTGQPVEKIEEDCDRDFFMTPEESKDYGLIDEVIKTKRIISKPPRPELVY